MPSFTPPTDRQSMPGDRLFSRFGMEVGQSVLRRSAAFGDGGFGLSGFGDGEFVTVPFPWIGELTGEEGTDWFLGGRTYVITDAVAADLTGSGYTVEADPGYGVGPYGSGPYGG